MSITRTAAGLITSDNFTRADAGTPGGNWTTNTGTCAIVSNELDCSGATRPGVVNGASAARLTNFTQAKTRHESTAFGPSLAHYAAAARTGYAVRQDSNTFSIDEYNGGTFTGTVSTIVANQTLGSNYLRQLYATAGVQEGATESNVGNKTLAGADATHNGVSRVAWLHRANATNSANSAIFDDFLWMTTKVIVVTGMPGGYKAKVINGGASVVASATESGGTATIDASVFGGASEFVPFAGWAKLRITTGADVLVEEYTATGVYPGDEFSFAPAVGAPFNALLIAP